MSHYRSTSSRRRLLLGVTIGSAILAMAGCSSASDSGGDTSADGGKLSAAQQKCVDAANKFFDSRGGDLPKSLPTELKPLSKAPTKGVTITRISPGNTPISLELNEKIIAAATGIGWEGKGPTYDGSVEDANRKATDAINNSKAGDVVGHDGIPSSVLKAPIKAAQDKGQLFMLGSITDKPQSVPGFGGEPFGGAFWTKLGELAAYSMMRASNCTAHVQSIGIPSPPQVDVADMIGATLKKECSDCTFAADEIAYEDVGSPAATNAVVSKLQADPSINFVYFQLGDLAAGIGPALKQAGLEPKIGGGLPNRTNVAALKAGTDSFWIGLPTEISAYTWLDTAIRALESEKPVVGQYAPLSVLTPDNIGNAETVPVYPEDYKEQYLKLWKVAG